MGKGRTQSSDGTARKQARGDLSDAQWTLIAGLFPPQKRGGQWNDLRRTFDGIRRSSKMVVGQVLVWQVNK